MKKMSNYEEYIMKILVKENISFQREKSFSDLKKGKYRYDFYLPKHNICIECDGEQHFHQVKCFQKNRSDFLKQQEHDRQKNSFCLANNIPLYRIPYWEIKNIKNFQDILNNSFKVKSKWHNDNLLEPGGYR